MRKPKPPKLVTIAITTTITIIFWIFLTLYRVLTTKPAPSVDPALLEPIDSSLDTVSLENMKGRIFFEEGSFVPPPINNEDSKTNVVNRFVPSETPEPTAIPENLEQTETTSP